MEYQWYSTCQYWNGNQTYWTAKALNCWWKHFEKYPSLNLCLCPDNWKSLSFLLNWTAPLFGWFPKDKVLWIYWWWQLNVSPCFGSGFVVMYWLHELSLSHFLTQITVAAAIRLHFNTFPPHIWAHFRGHFWANFWGNILSYIRAYFWANFQTRIFYQCRVEIFRLSDLGRTFYYDYLEILGSPENVL